MESQAARPIIAVVLWTVGVVGALGGAWGAIEAENKTVYICGALISMFIFALGTAIDILARIEQHLRPKRGVDVKEVGTALGKGEKSAGSKRVANHH